MEALKLELIEEYVPMKQAHQSRLERELGRIGAKHVEIVTGERMNLQ